MKSLAILCALLLIGIFGACSSPTPTPTATPLPSPTSTPTFEQKRGEVLTYLRAFNRIDNDLDDVISQIRVPFQNRSSGSPISNAEIMLNVSSMAVQFMAAIEGAQKRLQGVSAPSFEADAADHLSRAKTYLERQRQMWDKVRTPASVGNQAEFDRQFAELLRLGEKASAINLATERLLLRYNISDGEANYTFRGK